MSTFIKALTFVSLTGIFTVSIHSTLLADPAYAIPSDDGELGSNEALRVYVEFADGGNRGMDDPETGVRHGYADENFDATTAMVVNWHRMPEEDPNLNARLRYRPAPPNVDAGSNVGVVPEDDADWIVVEGLSYEFWHRPEYVNRVILRDLAPNSVYELQVIPDGRTYRFRTMPANLDERPVKIVFTGDHQQPSWTEIAHQNARMAAAQKPDMFVVAGDFVNDEGNPTEGNAGRWATYLDTLFGVDSGYFFYDKEIDGQVYQNLMIPHLAIVGNHEVGREHHLRWPTCVVTVRNEPGYPRFTAANWTELLFHWPYKSEGFRCELHSDHPNIVNARDGFGHGGFGGLGFGDYLLLIALDNCCQNWAGEPTRGLRDWRGEPITDRWPWFENLHAEVRQDLWLRDLLEPEGQPPAGERYAHIIPVFHRGLFGTARPNMSLKNRDLLAYWLPILHRNNVRFIKEAHDHLYTRTIPMGISREQPEGTYLDRVAYQPHSWQLPENLPQDYLDEFFTVSVIRDNETDEITGWEYQGYFISHDPGGFIAQGHGGWAGGRRQTGDRSGGNAGYWFVDPAKGGESFGGNASFHLTTVHLTGETLTFESFHPSQLENFLNGTEPTPINRTKWNHATREWTILYPPPTLPEPAQ